MYLRKLCLFQYRNYNYIKMNLNKKINIFIGPNAQGKTNLIEAIYYLSTGKSYRPSNDNQLIMWERDSFKIVGEVENKFGDLNLEITFIPNSLGKELKIDGLKISKLSQLFGNCTAVLFAPEDMYIIKGSPIERRKLLDYDISQVCPSYYVDLQKYSRILQQRNHLLKKYYKNRDNNELDVWNYQLAHLAEKIVFKRLEVLEKLVPLTRLMQRRLTNGQENLEIKYIFNKKFEVKKSDDIKNLVIEEINKNREEEIRRGTTLWGPHRDDLSINLNGNNLKYYGSQGQHRTAVLAIKLAELEFFKTESGEYPILLLDDVLSELDIKRRTELLNTIKEKDIQCFITTTEEFAFLQKQTIDIKKYYIVNGSLIEDRGEK